MTAVCAHETAGVDVDRTLRIAAVDVVVAGKRKQAQRQEWIGQRPLELRHDMGLLINSVVFASSRRASTL